MKRKLTTMIMAPVIGLTLITGCGAKQASNYVDPSSQTQSTTEVAASSNISTTALSANAQQFPERGIAISVSPEYEEKGLQIEPPNENYDGYKTISIYYYYKPITDPLFENMLNIDPDERTQETEAAFYDELYAHSKCVMQITLVKTEDYKSQLAANVTLDDLSGWNNTTYLGENGGLTYLVSIPTGQDTSKMGDDELAQYQECLDYMSTVKDSLQFIDYVAEQDEAALPISMPIFKSQDLDGNEVSDNIFYDSDVTVVNCWGTFCTPCIDEMPDLAKWSQEMGDNVQLVGIVCDVDGAEDTEHLELARKISEKAGVEFVNIIPDSKIKDELMKGIIAFPTTFLVDRFGNIIPDSIVEGDNFEQYQKNVENYLKELEEDAKNPAY